MVDCNPRTPHTPRTPRIGGIRTPCFTNFTKACNISMPVEGFRRGFVGAVEDAVDGWRQASYDEVHWARLGGLEGEVPWADINRRNGSGSASYHFRLAKVSLSQKPTPGQGLLFLQQASNRKDVEIKNWSSSSNSSIPRTDDDQQQTLSVDGDRVSTVRYRASPEHAQGEQHKVVKKIVTKQSDPKHQISQANITQLSRTSSPGSFSSRRVVKASTHVFAQISSEKHKLGDTGHAHAPFPRRLVMCRPQTSNTLPPTSFIHAGGAPGWHESPSRCECPNWWETAQISSRIPPARLEQGERFSVRDRPAAGALGWKPFVGGIFGEEISLKEAAGKKPSNTSFIMPGDGGEEVDEMSRQEHSGAVSGNHSRSGEEVEEGEKMFVSNSGWIAKKGGWGAGGGRSKVQGVAAVGRRHEKQVGVPGCLEQLIAEGHAASATDIGCNKDTDTANMPYLDETKSRVPTAKDVKTPLPGERLPTQPRADGTVESLFHNQSCVSSHDAPGVVESSSFVGPRDAQPDPRYERDYSNWRWKAWGPYIPSPQFRPLRLESRPARQRGSSTPRAGRSGYDSLPTQQGTGATPTSDSSVQQLTSNRRLSTPRLGVPISATPRQKMKKNSRTLRSAPGSLSISFLIKKGIAEDSADRGDDVFGSWKGNEFDVDSPGGLAGPERHEFLGEEERRSSRGKEFLGEEERRSSRGKEFFGEEERRSSRGKEFFGEEERRSSRGKEFFGEEERSSGGNML